MNTYNHGTDVHNLAEGDRVAVTRNGEKIHDHNVVASDGPLVSFLGNYDVGDVIKVAVRTHGRPPFLHEWEVKRLGERHPVNVGKV